MNSWTPLWSQVVDSSLWEEKPSVRVLFVTMLALKDADHKVRYDAYKLHKKANLTPEDTKEALEVLKNPDTRRRQFEQEFDGRRIEELPDGYLILNGEKYRALIQKMKQREYKTQWQRDKREEQKNTETPIKSPVRYGFQKPTIEEVKLHCAKIGLPDAEADAFWNYYESNGWKVGKNPMRSWMAAMINWKKIYEKGTFNGNHGTLNGKGHGINPAASRRNAGTLGDTDYGEAGRRKLLRQEADRLAKEAAQNGTQPPAVAGDGRPTV